MTPAAPREGRLATSELAGRLDMLARWARGRADRQPTLRPLIGLANALRHLLGVIGVDATGRLELRRLCDEVAVGGAVGGGQAGLASVHGPGGVLGPADVIVWWGFTRDRARAPAKVRLSRAERTALAATGATPPDLGGQMEAEAARWRRPLESGGGGPHPGLPDDGGRRRTQLPAPSLG